MGQGHSRREEEFLATDAAARLAAKQFYRRATFRHKVGVDKRWQARQKREAKEVAALVEVPAVGSWVPPSRELAKEFQSEHHPRIAGPHGTWVRFPLNTSIMRLGSEFGPGVALYFRFLVFLGIMFFIMAACASPWVGINQVAIYRFNNNGTFGDPVGVEQIKTFTKTGARLEGLTLAGVLEVPGYSKETQAYFLIDAKVAGKQLQVTREKYTALIQLMDIFGTLCFVAGIAIFFRHVVPKISDRIDEDTLEVSDYTIKVSGLPKNTEIEEVVEFFESRYGDVIEVQMCQDDYMLVTLFNQRMDLVRELKRSQARYAKGVDKVYKSKPIQKRIRKLDKKIRKLQKRSTASVCAAFVTFDQERSIKHCLREFEATTTFFGWLFYRRSLRLRGMHKLKVKRAEPPTNISYENLKFSTFNRKIRKFCVFLSLIVILIGTFLAVTEIRFRVEELQRKTLIDGHVLNSQLDTSSSFGVGYLLAGASSGNTELFKIRETACQPYLDQCQEHLGAATDSGIELKFGRLITYNDTAGGDDSGLTNGAIAEMKICYGATSSSDCASRIADPTTQTHADPALYQCYACYCEGLYRGINIKKPSKVGIVDFTTGDVDAVEAQCKPYYQDSQSLLAARWGLDVFTTSINTLLKYCILWLVRLEKSHSKAEEEASLFTWVVFTQYINTAVLDMLANANVRVASNALANSGFGGRILNGKYSDFTHTWYAEVGNNLLYTVLISSIGLPFAERIYVRLNAWFWRWWAGKTALIQEDMDAAYVGPEYQLSIKLAETMMPVCVALTYGTGIPLLYIVVAFSCLAVRYWVDRHELLRVCRTPPRYLDSIIRPAYSFLMFFMGIHLAVGGWMIGHYWCRTVAQYSNEFGVTSTARLPPEIASANALSSSVQGDFSITRLFQANCAGSYIFVACLLVGFVLFRVIIQGFFWDIMVSSVIGNFLCCCIKNCCKKKIQLDGLPTFSDAFECSLLKGLTSYSIVDHPEYRRAFAIVNLPRTEPQVDAAGNRIDSFSTYVSSVADSRTPSAFSRFTTVNEDEDEGMDSDVDDMNYQGNLKPDLEDINGNGHGADVMSYPVIFSDDAIDEIQGQNGGNGQDTLTAFPPVFIDSRTGSGAPSQVNKSKSGTPAPGSEGGVPQVLVWDPQAGFLRQPTVEASSDHVQLQSIEFGIPGFQAIGEQDVQPQVLSESGHAHSMGEAEMYPPAHFQAAGIPLPQPPASAPAELVDRSTVSVAEKSEAITEASAPHSPSGLNRSGASIPGSMEP